MQAEAAAAKTNVTTMKKKICAYESGMRLCVQHGRRRRRLVLDTHLRHDDRRMIQASHVGPPDVVELHVAVVVAIAMAAAVARAGFTQAARENHHKNSGPHHRGYHDEGKEEENVRVV
jgi:hypothetical protein